MLKITVILLLTSLSLQALNQQADLDIRTAIKAAVLDGLNTLDNYVMQNYWYFLRGAKKVSFNVTIQPTKLNYIRIYSQLGLIFRVNADIDKITWQPSINSFVQIASTTDITALLTPNISIVNQQNKVTDLTNQISVTPQDLKEPKYTATPVSNQKPQIIAGGSSSGQGIVILSSSQQPTPPSPNQSLTKVPPS